MVSSRDPLLNYKKPRLVTELRTARARRDQMEQQYQALLQEHMQCGLAIARLETQLAEHLAFLERFRSSLQNEEHGPQS
jgi:chromosome segregation ATPase